MAAATASQTIGPYWHLLEDKSWADLTRFGAVGERIVVEGRMRDGDDAPVTDACVEIWQTSPEAEDFPGFGRCATDAEGWFRFTTLKPGPVGGNGNALQAPHLALTIFARGIMIGLRSRIYFAGEALNATDPLLCAIEDAERRASLIAEATVPGVWRRDIRLQGGVAGAPETVFLDL